MAKNTQSALTTESAPTTFDPSQLATIIGGAGLVFSSGKGDSKQTFTHAWSDLTLPQAIKVITYGAKRLFNDWYNPTAAKVKSGDLASPTDYDVTDPQDAFDYWVANVFGQVHVRSTSGPSGTPIEKQAISEYLASRPKAFGALYTKVWIDQAKLTPKGKPSAKPRPSSLAALQECLTAIAGGSLSTEKWAAVQKDIDGRKAAILKARSEAEANAKQEDNKPEDLF